MIVLDASVFVAARASPKEPAPISEAETAIATGLRRRFFSRALDSFCIFHVPLK